MQKETNLRYWINVNRPELQFRTNGLSCWRRFVGTDKWVFHDGLAFENASKYRYEVTLEELERI